MLYPRPRPQDLKRRLDSGLAAHRVGDLGRALQAYRDVLAAEPDHASALNLFGTALLQLGNAAEAVPYLERATRRTRDDPHLLANLAQAYMAVERYSDACDVFRKASRIAPNEAQLHVGVGAALALAGKLDEAHAMLLRLTRRFPTAPLVWLNLGNVLRDQHRFEEATEAYSTAHTLDPNTPDARNSIGRMLHARLRFAEAEREYRACIAAAPDYLIARYNLASVLMDLGRFSEAEAECREIVARVPNDAAAVRLLGTALAHQARLLEALTCYERAVRIAPNERQNAQAYGAGLMEAGHAAAGLRWLAHAEFLDPTCVPVRQVTSGALLADGCLRDGWIDYAYRPAAIELREKHQELEPVLSLPDDLHGKHVCVIAEQGLGDQLFFLRYVPQIAARGARLSCRPAGALYSLLQRSPELHQVILERTTLPGADICVLAGDLPRALADLPASALHGAGSRDPASVVLPDFHRRIAIFWPPPAPSLRLAPDADRLVQLRQQLATLGPPPYFGLTWRGGTAPDEQHATALLYKSIALPALGGVLRALPATVIALQRLPAPGEIEALSSFIGRQVHDLTALNDDLEGMLALLSLIDEYIGVSNTNMHLRAAAAKTGRVLVPMPAEWRWMRSGRYSPWFPGFPIYRQSVQGDWSAALTQLECDLNANYGTARQPNAG